MRKGKATEGLVQHCIGKMRGEGKVEFWLNLSAAAFLFHKKE